MASEKVRELFTFQMVPSTLGAGKIMKCMDKELDDSLTATSTMEHTAREKDMDRGDVIMQMAIYT